MPIFPYGLSPIPLFNPTPRRPNTARQLIQAYGADPSTSIPQIDGHEPVPQLNLQNQYLSAPLPPPSPIEVARAQALGAAQQPGGLGRILGSVFYGQDDPNLSPEQNEQLRKQAQLAAGLKMLELSGPSVQPRSLGQIVGAGAQHGQQVGAQGREKAVAQHEQQMIAQAMQSSDPMTALQQLAQEALRQGRTDVAQAAAYQMQVLRMNADAEQKAAAAAGGGEQMDYNMRYGTAYNPATDRVEEYRVDPRDPNAEREWLGPKDDPEQIASEREWQRLDRQDRQLDRLGTDYRNLNNDYGLVEMPYFYQNGTDGLAMNNAVGDRAAIQSVARIMDPNSTVREGEFRVWASSEGLDDWIVKASQKLDEGRLLSDEERKMLGELLDKTYRNKQQQVRPLLNTLRERAKALGLDPDMVAPDPFASIGGATAASGGGKSPAEMSTDEAEEAYF